MASLVLSTVQAKEQREGYIFYIRDEPLANYGGEGSFFQPDRQFFLCIFLGNIFSNDPAVETIFFLQIKIKQEIVLDNFLKLVFEL